MVLLMRSVIRWDSINIGTGTKATRDLTLKELAQTLAMMEAKYPQVTLHDGSSIFVGGGAINGVWIATVINHVYVTQVAGADEPEGKEGT